MTFEEDNRQRVALIRKVCFTKPAGFQVDREFFDYFEEEELGHKNIFELEGFLTQLNDDTTREEPANVLEIGCGVGRAIGELQMKFPKINFYGIDVAAENLSTTNRQVVSLIHGDAQYLPFRESSIDVIFSVVALPYFVDKVKTVYEAYKVLRLGGRGYLTVKPSYFSPSGRFLFPDKNKDSDVFWDNRYRTLKIVKEENGFPSKALDLAYDHFENLLSPGSIGHLSKSVISCYEPRRIS